MHLGLQPVLGLQDVLLGKAALEQVVMTTPQRDLHLLPAGATALNGTPLPADALCWAFAWLRQRFDLVLVESPAWTAGNEYHGLMQLADAVYLVVDSAEAQQPAVRTAARLIAAQGGRVGGLIVSHADAA
jgi:Mrp family chromosome partitioning ATPase